MNTKIILLVITLLTLSSCSFWKTTETESTWSTLDNGWTTKEVNVDIKNNKDVKVNEMTDTRTDDEAVEEFEKDVEDILKLLEDNAE